MENKCYIGLREIKGPIFDVYFKDKKTQEIVKIFKYKGLEDLYHPIFSESCIYFLEGKTFPTGTVAWIWAGTKSFIRQADSRNIQVRD
ncbi:hypothetical protein A9239_12595 [Methanosarcina sp. A14]|uniref:Uncharacterized protein n=2 Tax=Methanosarcina barkeri TaxID=2208 RepID=A0A0E3LNU6_METBA|nr:hypothetical protein [Methanosarcina barkeri]AKB55386.1 hypothetical protein MSBRM_2388 [Methanosarcina barkeri MS]AKB58870.1 hypothetical protein MSBR2_2354 [Methanosarcina barkeri 227]OED04876.1 hypothetical protein A9239_12595 [Methanosarcina sp. A14]